MKLLMRIHLIKILFYCLQLQCLLSLIVLFKKFLNGDINNKIFKKDLLIVLI